MDRYGRMQGGKKGREREREGERGRERERGITIRCKGIIKCGYMDG